MQVKAPDDKTRDLTILTGLLKRKGLYPTTKAKIEKAIRNMRSGMQGEAEAAYEMNFHYGEHPEWVILHDLRLVHEGRVAQIDHLIINRALQFWVCESKNFSEGVAFNEHGECVAFREGKPYGFPSPIEQNKKHLDVLQAVLDAGLVKIPKGKYFKMEPELKSLILVSKNARVSRPKTGFPGLETVVKNEQLKNQLETAFARARQPGQKRKLASEKTLHTIAENLLALHQPIQFNWEAMFKLSSSTKSTPRAASTFGTKRKNANINNHAPSTTHRSASGAGSVVFTNKADTFKAMERQATSEVESDAPDDVLPLPGWLALSM